MKVQKSKLEMMIKEMLLEALDEQKEVSVDKSRRLRNEFKLQKNLTSTPTDPNTPKGRENLLAVVRPAFNDVQTRLQIIQRQIINAFNSEDRKSYKQYLIIVFENLQSLQKEMQKLISSYSKMLETMKISSPTKPATVTESILDPDTPQGRRNLLKGTFAKIGEMREMVEEAAKMLSLSERVSTASVFYNEIKAFGKQLFALNKELVNLNSEFVKAFQAYESQRGRASVPPTPPRKSSGPPPIPATARKKTVT